MLTHRMVPSPPRQIMKSISRSRFGSSSCSHVSPSPVSQRTTGSTQVVIPLLCRMACTLGSIAVVFLSLGFLITRTFRGRFFQLNCECGTPRCRVRMDRSAGSCTSHPSSLHSNSWNGTLESRWSPVEVLGNPGVLSRES